MTTIGEHHLKLLLSSYPALKFMFKKITYVKGKSIMRNTTILQTVLCAFLFTTGISHTQDHENIQLVTQLSFNSWNNAEAIALDGDYAYVVDADSGLRIVDISRPISPQEVALFAYEGLVWDVAAEDGYAYLAAGNDGVIVIDATDPVEPEQVAVQRDIGDVRGITVSDDHAYIAAGRDGFWILDISEPAEIEPSGEIGTPGFAIRIAVADNYAYIADRMGGMRVINIVDPTEPVEVGSIEPEGETRDVAVAGEFAFLAETEGVSRINISNPVNPRRIDIHRFDQPVMVLATNGDYVYVGVTSLGFVVLAVEQEMENVGCLSLSPIGMVLRGEYVFAVDHGNGLIAVDVSDPMDPFEAGRCGSRISNYAVDISGDYIFFSTYPVRIMVYDVSDPAEPILVWRDAPYIRMSGRDVFINEWHLFSVDEIRFNSPLRIADIRNPDDLQWLGECNVTGNPQRIAFNGDLLYVTNELGNTKIIDISDLSSPRVIGNISRQGEGHHNDLAVIGDLAYIATGRLGLVVKDVADPLNIRDIGTYDPESEIRGITIRDDHAFLACNNCLEVINIANPREIQRVGICDLPGTGWRVTLAGNHAFIACCYGGLRVLNISDLNNPCEVGYYDTPGRALDIAVAGHLAFVADREYIGIYDCSEALSVDQKPERNNLPTEFALLKIYPNPFNSTTKITYSLPNPEYVSVTVIDLNGREAVRLVDGILQPGIHSAFLCADNLSAGMYVVRMEVFGKVLKRKLVLIR